MKLNARVETLLSIKKRCFYQVLREARKEAGLTQGELACKIQQPQSFVSRYEAGKRRLEFLELHEICEALAIGAIEFARRFEEVLRRAIRESSNTRRAAG